MITPAEGVLSGPRHYSRRALGVGTLAVIALTLGFLLMFWNRFGGVRSGNGSIVGAEAILAGKLPYRDWFCATPPLHPLKELALVQIFGTNLIVPRAVALFERTVLALIVFFWLARVFRISHAVLGAVLAIVISAGDIADPISSYNHDTILYAVLSGFFASLVIDRCSKRSGLSYALVSGLFAGLCVSSKQTIGLGVTVGVPVVVAAWTWRCVGFRRSAAVLLAFTAGWTVPVVAIWTWLLHQSVLRQYFSDIFFRGPAAKGTPGIFLLRTLIALKLNLAAALIGLFTLALFLGALGKMRSARGGAVEPLRAVIWVSLLAATALTAGWFAAQAGVNRFTRLPRPSIYFVLLASGLIGSHYLIQCLRRRLSVTEAHFWLLSAVSFIVAFMLFLSWPGFEAMVIPGLGFFVAALLEVWQGWRRLCLLALCAALLFSQTLAKLNAPYGFEDWMDAPVRSATSTSSLPEMRGFLLPEPTVRLIDGVTNTIRQHSSPGDSIFTYPNMPLFYALTGRWWPTYSVDQNMDVTSDAIARRDAATLLRTRPSVIVYYAQEEGFLKFEELVWRFGKRSGQRDIISAIEALAKEYELAGIFDAPPTDHKIKVYVRR